MVTTLSTPGLATLEARIAPLRQQLTVHPLYSSIRSEAALRTFMEAHVFAVWDFMSLLKALQRELTCIDLPWTPTRFPESRRFINEIVLGEESDEYEGRPASHFELYLEAMEQAGADVRPMQQLLGNIHSGRFGASTTPWDDVSMPAAARRFVESTFAVIDSGSLAAKAAAFTFGREDLIPDMFQAMVGDLNRAHHGRFNLFLWYLERHIEVDGEDHGPLSLRMVASLCGVDEALWEEATVAAETALRARLQLWDGILASLPGQ